MGIIFLSLKVVKWNIDAVYFNHDITLCTRRDKSIEILCDRLSKMC